MRSVAASHASASDNALEFSVFASPGAVKITPGTFKVAAGCWAGGLVTLGKSAATAAGLDGIPAAANTAAEPPKPWPTTPSLAGCTLILPGPSRTLDTMSSAVPRSKAKFSTDGARPRWVSGAPATMPHDARCSSRFAYRAVPASQSWPNATPGRFNPSSGVYTTPGRPAKARSPRKTRCGPRRLRAATSLRMRATR